MYIAQGLSLSLLDEALFPKPIEAWKYGHVIPSIYHEFKHFGKDPIDKRSITLGEYGEKREADDLSDEEKKRVFKLTWNLFKGISARKLIDLTHDRGIPWSLTYIPEENRVINNELIKKYYDKFMVNLKKAQMSSSEKPDNQNRKFEEAEEIEEALPKDNTDVIENAKKTSKVTTEEAAHIENLKDKKQDRDERKKYAHKSFTFLWIFTAVILLILIFNCLSQCISFKLSDKVLMVLISTSFASAIGIFAFVMKYLFKK